MYLKMIVAGSVLALGLIGASAAQAESTSNALPTTVASLTCSQLMQMSADAQTRAGAGSYVAACQAASPSSTVQDAVSHNTNSTPTNNGNNGNSGNSAK